MRAVFLLCVCSARSEGQVAIGYVSSAAAAPARRGEFIKEDEEEATNCGRLLNRCFRSAPAVKRTGKLFHRAVSGLRRRLAPPPFRPARRSLFKLLTTRRRIFWSGNAQSRTPIQVHSFALGAAQWENVYWPTFCSL